MVLNQINQMTISQSRSYGDLIEMENNDQHELALAWVNLSLVSCSTFGRGKKIILDNINGQVMFGQITALMGPSGAGKTSLLRCINGLYRSSLSSDTELYAHPKETIRPSFVVQDQSEHLIMELTVRESLIYSSMLKNRNESGALDHESIVNKVLEKLMLVGCADNRVSQCSGGEQKRLSIGLEMTAIDMPNLLCVDEPTSGLDSDAAEQVIMCLKSLTRHHQLAVVASIHQPNADVLMLFDRLYVMATGGHCVFDGLPRQLGNHLEDCGVPCLQHQVPIEVLIKVASHIDETTSSEHSAMRQTLINQTKKLQQQDQYFSQSDGRLLPNNSLSIKTRSFNLFDVYTLTCRSIKYSWVRRWSFQLTVLAITMLGLNAILVVYPDNIGKDAACPIEILNLETLPNITNQIYDRINGQRTDSQVNLIYVFFLNLFLTFIVIVTVNIHFPFDIKIFLNEHRNSWYSTSSFYLSKILTETPPLILLTYIYFWFGYWGASEPEMEHWYEGVWNVPPRFLNFVFVAALAMLVMQSLAMIVSVVFSKNPRLALSFAVALFILMVQLTDVQIPSAELEGNWKFFLNINYLNVVYNAKMIILYGGERCDTESELLTFYQLLEEDLPKLWRRLIYETIFWRFLAFVILLLKANPNLVDHIREILFTSKTANYSESQMKKKCLVKDQKNRKDNSSVQIAVTENIVTRSTPVIEKLNQSHSLAMAWIDLTYQPKAMFSSRKIILRKLNGQLKFGSLTALMGPSGSGKSSLLKSLFGLTANDLAEPSKFYVSKSQAIQPCFVVQNQTEHLLMGLTVSESLLFSSRLKNHNRADHQKIVDQLLDDFSLIKCKNTMIKKCSGGEQKRLSVACEMTSLVMPNLICIDEPTSGLDSHASEKTILCLYNFARKHQLAIVTSIHQPNQDLLAHYDHLYVLARGGWCVFDGNPNDLKAHLANCQIDCQDWQVPIEVLIKTASRSAQTTSGGESGDDDIIRLVEATNKSQEIIRRSAQVNGQLLTSPIGLNNLKFDLVDVIYLVRRGIVYSWFRNIKFLSLLAGVLIGQMLFFTNFYPKHIGSDFACIKERVNLTNISAINEEIITVILGNELPQDKNLKYLHFLITYVLQISVFTVCLLVPMEIRLFTNEHRNRWYSTTSYFISKLIVDLPIWLSIVYVYFWLGFYIVPQPEMHHWYQGIWDMPDTFKYSLLAQLLAMLTCHGSSLAFGIIFAEHIPFAIISATTFLLYSYLFAGFYLRLSSLQPWLLALGYPSFFRLDINLVLLQVFGGRCEFGSTALQRFLIDGEEEQTYWNTLIGQVFFWWLFGWVALLIRTNKQRFGKSVFRKSHDNQLEIEEVQVETTKL